MEASDDDDEPTDDEPTSTQTQRKSQRTKKGKAPIDESMDMAEDDEQNGTPEVSQVRHRNSKK